MSQCLILIVGHNGSGKSTLANKICQDFPALNHVNGDDMRNFLKLHIAYFNSVRDNTVEERTRQMNAVVNPYRLQITELLLNEGQSVVIDVMGITYNSRRKFLHMANEHVKTVIILCEVDEAGLLERLQLREKKWGSSWLEIHEKFKNSYEPPSLKEATTLLTYNQDNYDEIKAGLADIIPS